MASYNSNFCLTTEVLGVWAANKTKQKGSFNYTYHVLITHKPLTKEHRHQPKGHKVVLTVY